MVVNLFEKIVGPEVIKAVGKTGAIKFLGAASIGAGFANFVLDKTVGPVVDKGVNAAKNANAKFWKDKQSKMEAAKAAHLAQQNQENETIEVPAEQVEPVEVSGKPKQASSKRKNK